MKRLERIATMLFLGAVPLAVTGQDKVEAAVSADLVNSYIWRGQKLGDAAVQPALTLSYKGFSLGVWGSMGIVNHDDSKELDFTLSYSTGGFCVGVTDYYIGDDGDKYFLYDAHETQHTFEAFAGYDFGVASITWYTNFAGNDGVSKSGKRAYSSYFEMSAPFRFGGLEWSATLGAVPYSTDFYEKAGGFAVTNVSLKASKEIKVTERFGLPLFASVIGNPSSRKMYLTAGISF